MYVYVFVVVGVTDIVIVGEPDDAGVGLDDIVDWLVTVPLLLVEEIELPDITPLLLIVCVGEFEPLMGTELAELGILLLIDGVTT